LQFAGLNLDHEEQKVAPKIVPCFEGHACQQLNSLPAVYKYDGVFCDKCKGSIFYDEVWFHHCPLCKTDFCQKCSGKIDEELHNPLYWKTW